MDIYSIIQILEDDIRFPMFIKPSNSGSSVGINKAKNRKEIENAIENASRFDNKILIEEEIIGKEVECAILGNENVVASEVRRNNTCR